MKIKTVKKIIFITFILIFLYKFKFCNNFLNKMISYNYYNYIYNKNSLIKNYIKLFKNNSKLLSEIDLLKNELNDEKFKNLILKRNINNNKNILKKINFNIIKACVINRNIINNVYTINKGLNHNIKVGQVVLDKNGVIGQIINVYKDKSNFLSICSKKILIPSFIKRSNFKCILKGCGYKNELYFYHIDNEMISEDDIKIGDIFLTSGLDNKFIKNIPVAIVKYVKIKNFRINKIYIKPLFYAFLIKNVFIINK
ncbi:rod shape-determining protein MreC [endosymbiont of Euscepes postfasciatus]|uniref:rod shape-determining protein MreC n=1 Tax=endosymbiont of Euscepes postfasciatus TaxID=650377 RepID=UPI000DC7162C|nr:rod shape-determining protein MreC [endosymbiont of Euscepes postfasciatus]BBA84718.1 rod shape-determining protein MreC [endosymbiont of Euscepes postfasciatus]